MIIGRDSMFSEVRDILQNNIRDGIPLLKGASEELKAQGDEMLNMDLVSDLGAGLAASGQHEEALTLVVNALCHRRLNRNARPMSQMGQNRKNSLRANVFRCSSNNGFAPIPMREPNSTHSDFCAWLDETIPS
jgi:hypothetical protein